MGIRGAIVLAAIALSASRVWALNESGNEFRVNTYTTANQINGAVAGLQDGGFAVVWESDLQDASRLGVFGRTFDSTAGEVAAEFELTDYYTRDQHEVSVAGLSDGNFVVTWTSDERDGSGDGVFGQIFDVDGESQLDDDFQVNSYTTDDQGYARVATFGDGFVVVWTSTGQDGSLAGIFGQRFDIDGETVGTEFRVNSYTTANQRTASVVGFPSHSFVVAWTSIDPGGAATQDGSGGGVVAQRFSAAGARVGTEIQLNSITSLNQVRPVLARANDGGFIAAWEGQSLEVGAASTDGVSARHFSPAGVAEGAEFQVNTYTTGLQEDVSIGAFPAAEMLVTWESDGGSAGNITNSDFSDKSNSGVFGRRLSASGTVIGSEFQVNTYTTRDQDDPQVAPLVNGNYVVIWESSGQDGSGGGVFGQLYTADICGDANNDGTLTAEDARRVLEGAIAGTTCEKCICDADGNGTVQAPDALAVLRAAIGMLGSLACLSC